MIKCNIALCANVFAEVLLRFVFHKLVNRMRNTNFAFMMWRMIN